LRVAEWLRLGSGQTSPAAFLDSKTAIDSRNLRILVFASAMARSHPDTFSTDLFFEIIDLFIDAAYSFLAMEDAAYEQVLDMSLDNYIKLVEKRIETDYQLEKLQQFMYATIHLLSNEAAQRFLNKWQPWIERLNIRNASLTDSVRSVLRTSYPKKLTSSEVRDAVRNAGFDFSSYKSDPLPSVATTLRRLKDSEEIECDEFEGVAVYQAKAPIIQRGALANAFGGIFEDAGYVKQFLPEKTTESKK
jgi:hypothetical protein